MIYGDMELTLNEENKHSLYSEAQNSKNLQFATGDIYAARKIKFWYLIM